MIGLFILFAILCDSQPTPSPSLSPNILVKNYVKIPSNGAQYLRFGADVAISGMYAAISATNPNAVGSVYIYRDDGTFNWVQIQIILNPLGQLPQSDYFGHSIAFNTKWLVIGAPSTGSCGTVHIFRKDALNDQWSFHSSVQGSTTVTGSQFGYSCDINEDYIVIGARKYNTPPDEMMGPVTTTLPPGETRGKAFVFKYDSINDQWTETYILEGSNLVMYDSFGESVAISPNTNQVVVGAPNNDYLQNDGSVYIFDLLSGTQKTKFTKFIGFGRAVAISDTYLFVGMNNADGDIGAVFVYNYDTINDLWSNSEILKLTGYDVIAGDKFGNAVSATDEHLIIGASFWDYQGNSNDLPVGAIYVFCHDPILHWNLCPNGKIRGDSVSFIWGDKVSTNKYNIIVGDYNDFNAQSNTQTQTGSTYIISLHKPPSVETINPSKAPSKSPTQLATTNPFEPVININVTINQSNISTTAVINKVQESVDNYINVLSVSFNYTLVVDFIRNTDIVTIIVFGIYTTDISDGEYIDVDELDEQITNDLDENFGDGVVIVVVTKVDEDAVYEAQKTFFQQVLIIIAVLFIFIVFAIFIHSKKCKKNDYFKVGPLFSGALQILDCISDIFFIVLIRYHPELTFSISFSSPLFILFILSVVVILVTVLCTIYQLHYTINKYWLVNDEIRDWLNKYTLYLYVISLITGSSFVAVQICSCCAFGMPIFSMPLSGKDRNLFLYRRVYSVVLMENIPQLALAIWFIMATHTNIDGMVYISMIFSAISIVISFVTHITAKKLVKTQDYCHVSMDFTGNMFDFKKVEFCSQNTNDIKNNLSFVLGLKSSMVEILRPQEISRGVKVTILLYISNAKYEQSNIKDILYNEHTTGSLSTMFKNAWHLSSLPNIDNIICEQIASKHRQKAFNNVGTSEVINLGV